MPAPVKSTSTAALRCRAFYYQAPGLEPARVRALSKREAFVASRRRRRQAPEAGADLRSKYADVPLPAPWSKEDFGNGRFSPLCSHTSPDLGMPLKPVRICEANTRTSRCPLHRVRGTSGTSGPTRCACACARTGSADRSRCVFAKQMRGRPHARSNSKMLG